MDSLFVIIVDVRATTYVPSMNVMHDIFNILKPNLH
jgi:hypothetical protein